MATSCVLLSWSSRSGHFGCFLWSFRPAGPPRAFGERCTDGNYQLFMNKESFTDT